MGTRHSAATQGKLDHTFHQQFKVVKVGLFPEDSVSLSFLPPHFHAFPPTYTVLPLFWYAHLGLVGFLGVFLFICFVGLVTSWVSSQIGIDRLKQIKWECTWGWKGMNLALSQLGLSQLWNNNLRSQRVCRIHAISKELRSSPKSVF